MDSKDHKWLWIWNFFNGFYYGINFFLYVDPLPNECGQNYEQNFWMGLFHKIAGFLLVSVLKFFHLLDQFTIYSHWFKNAFLWLFSFQLCLFFFFIKWWNSIKKFVLCMNKCYFCRTFFLTDWRHSVVKIQ